jgi:ABC-2 type transport system ATP-binding protein
MNEPPRSSARPDLPEPRSSLPSLARAPRPKRDIVVLEGVHARDTAGPKGQPRGSLQGLSLGLTDAVHVFLGTPEDGTLALADVLSGAERPMRGRVLVEGRDPAKHARIRSRIGVLSAMPRLPAAPSVDASVGLAMSGRGERAHRFDAVLDPFGLSALHSRSLRSLSYAEARAVELALALTTPGVRLLVLHEPLVDVATGALPLVRQQIRAAVLVGACVVVTTSSPADARALGDRIIVLERGAVARVVGGEGVGLASPEGELVVWVKAAAAGPGVRQLAAALSARAEVRAVAWDDPGQQSPGGMLRLRGDLDAIALAVADATLETGVVVEAMTTVAPGMDAVHAVTERLLAAQRSSSRAPTNVPPTQSGPAPATAPPTQSGPPPEPPAQFAPEQPNSEPVP